MSCDEPSVYPSHTKGALLIYFINHCLSASLLQPDGVEHARALVKGVSTPRGNRLRDRRTAQWCTGRQRWSDVSNANVQSASSARPTNRAMTSKSPD